MSIKIWFIWKLKNVCPSVVMVQISSASNWPQIKVLDFINFGPIYSLKSSSWTKWTSRRWIRKWKKLVRIKTSNLIHTRTFEATSEATYRLVLLSSIKTGKHNFENLQQSICRVLLNINDFAFYVFNMRFILHSSLIHWFSWYVGVAPPITMPVGMLMLWLTLISISNPLIAKATTMPTATPIEKIKISFNIIS